MQISEFPPDSCGNPSNIKHSIRPARQPTKNLALLRKQSLAPVICDLAVAAFLPSFLSWLFTSKEMGSGTGVMKTNI